MKKIYFYLAGAFILLVILIIIFNLFNKAKIAKTNVIPSPTPVAATNQSNEETAQVLSNFQALGPIETADFTAEYSSSLNKVVIQEKTSDAKTKFFVWANQNGYPELVDNNDLVVFNEQTASGMNLSTNPDSNPLIDFLNIFLNFGQGSSQSTPTNPSSTTTSPAPSSTLNPGSSSYTYYPQCDGYDNYPLPSGCTVCRAGCGPTTVSMIAASYLGSSYNPQTIVDLYKSKGYLLGCGGSRYTDAKALIESLGLKTTSFMIYNFVTADQVAPDFKNYIDAGWTIFTLANYCDGGCGHFFWVTSVDNGNIMAYDPYYGRFSDPPINENSRYPYPLYRIAFGVKK